MDFKLRPWTIDDVDSLVKYANNIHIAQYMTDSFPHPYTLKNANAFITMATHGLPVRFFAIEIQGEAAGGIGIHPQSDIQCKNAELGYWLAEPYWRNGIITKAIREMVAFGFQTYPITRIFARPFGTNIASQKALEKAGFMLEAKFEKTFFKNGVFLDEYIYAVRRR